ncbi:uncharacterized protein LOC111002247 [Pieris rapae]|uniref:uncharacterized protein LOC111002247 n=1 Tax=Pieris rapae TaxID=64459 RepID=UPI000B929CE5|nr:uncharacterized protein LOC111002247 [Pieris rapae]
MNSKYQEKKRIKKPKHPNLLKSNYSGASLEDVNILDDSLQYSQRCALVAKDSEWIDIIGRPSNQTNYCNTPSGEEIAQPENESQIQPLTLMFPNLLQEPAETLEAIANKTLSTTEVTKHLIGHKAHFELLKKVNRLIPPEKEWLPPLSECSNSADSSDFSVNDKSLSSAGSKQKIWTPNLAP